MYWVPNTESVMQRPNQNPYYVAIDRQIALMAAHRYMYVPCPHLETCNIKEAYCRRATIVSFQDRCCWSWS